LLRDKKVVGVRSFVRHKLVFMPFWCLYDGFLLCPIFLNSNDIYRKVEDVAVILLLPLFFCIYRFENRNRAYQ
jgi:uncharacterized membrane protein